MDNLLNMQLPNFSSISMSKINKDKVWQEVLESIKVSVSSAIYSTWFSQTHLASIKKTEKRYIAEIGCKSSYVKTTIEGRYFGLIQDTLTKSLDAPCDVIFIIKEDPNDKKGADLISPLFDTDKEKSDGKISSQLARSGIRSTFTFDNYAVSTSNQMAWAASDAVTRNPGNAYNPLFIWGGVGVGKTHLMNAVGYTIIKNNPEHTIVTCSGEQFTNDIVEGIRNRSTQKVRSKYRKLKALFIDDVQFIAGKDAVQEEFFHTFNALVNNGSQIILTSDKPPSEISKLEERLRSRFEAGLIVDVSPPDFELRCAIIQIKSNEQGINLPMDLVQLVAGNIDSARKIEGFLIRLSSETSFKNKDITQDFIESLLGKGEEDNGQILRAHPNEIINAVCKYFSIGKREITGSTRSRPIARPRQICMYILRTQLSLPLQEIGRIIGGRDHTTVMHAVDKITQLASSDVQIRQDIRGIKNML